MKRRICVVYRARRNAETYLFVDHSDGFARVPAELLERMGGTEHVITLGLAPERRLARTTGAEVLAAIDRQGYYLQIPPLPTPLGEGAPAC